MVYAIIDISDEANRILNIVKAKYGLKNKSQAIERVAEDYAHEENLEVRPEYIKKLKKIMKEKTKTYKSLEEMRAEYEKE